MICSAIFTVREGGCEAAPNSRRGSSALHNVGRGASREPPENPPLWIDFEAASDAGCLRCFFSFTDNLAPHPTAGPFVSNAGG